MRRFEKFRKEQKRLEKIAEEREIAATAAEIFKGSLYLLLDALEARYEANKEKYLNGDFDYLNNI